MREKLITETFNIVKDVTIEYIIDDKIYLMLIEIDYGHYLLEVNSRDSLIGRRLLVHHPYARFVFGVFEKKLKGLMYYEDAIACLSQAFSFERLFEATFAIRVARETFSQSSIGKLKKTFAFDANFVFDDDEKDKTGKPVKIKVSFKGSKKEFGYFQGTFMGNDFHFIFNEKIM